MVHNRLNQGHQSTSSIPLISQSEYRKYPHVTSYRPISIEDTPHVISYLESNYLVGFTGLVIGLNVRVGENGLLLRGSNDVCGGEKGGFLHTIATIGNELCSKFSSNFPWAAFF